MYSSCCWWWQFWLIVHIFSLLVKLVIDWVNNKLLSQTARKSWSLDPATATTTTTTWPQPCPEIEILLLGWSRHSDLCGDTHGRPGDLAGATRVKYTHAEREEGWDNGKITHSRWLDAADLDSRSLMTNRPASPTSQPKKTIWWRKVNRRGGDNQTHWRREEPKNPPHRGTERSSENRSCNVRSITHIQRTAAHRNSLFWFPRAQQETLSVLTHWLYSLYMAEHIVPGD